MLARGEYHTPWNVDMPERQKSHQHRRDGNGKCEEIKEGIIHERTNRVKPLNAGLPQVDAIGLPTLNTSLKLLSYQRDVIWLHVPTNCPPVHGVLSAIISTEIGTTVSCMMHPIDATLSKMLHNKYIRV